MFVLSQTLTNAVRVPTGVHTCAKTPTAASPVPVPLAVMLDNDDRTCVSKYGWTMMTIPVSVSIDRH